MVDANEPYQRVSEGNGTMQGGLIGAGIGAAGAGAFVGQSAYSYKKALPRVSERVTKSVDKSLNRLQEKNFALHSKLTSKRPNTEQRGPTSGRRVIGDSSSISNADNISGKKSDKYNSRLDKNNSKINKLNGKREDYSVKKMQEAHRYHKMGGWRNAGVIAGTAAIGAAAGSITNALRD